jgi:putative ABC transport system substrate-binding protein
MIGLRLAFGMILGLGGLFTPIAAEAQQAANIPRVGFLSAGSRSDPCSEVFRQALLELGYMEGKNIAIESHRR